jgi:hypothetical protein
MKNSRERKVTHATKEERRNITAKEMKNRLNECLIVLLPEEGPFPPRPCSRVSFYQQTQHKGEIEHPKRLELAE